MSRDEIEAISGPRSQQIVRMFAQAKSMMTDILLEVLAVVKILAGSTIG
jgi:hypothetical protein